MSTNLRELIDIECPKFLERFYSKIELIPFSACHWWVGCNSGGYGQISINGDMVYSHRVAYSMAVGEVPGDMEVCHKCDNPSCVNPDHLFRGTHSENMKDMVDKSRTGADKRRGEKNATSKLKDSQVMRIRGSIGTLASIGKRYGVSESTVSLIKKRKIWSHL